MACDGVQRWTLCTLVGAYVDLALAYLLLCGAALAFAAAKLLSFFGLSLPCPCRGLFADCLLSDHPVSRIAAVHLALRTRFPFDSILNAQLPQTPPLLEAAADRPESPSSSSSARGRGAKKRKEVVIRRRWKRASAASLSKNGKGKASASSLSSPSSSSPSPPRLEYCEEDTSAPMVNDDFIECCALEEEETSSEVGLAQLQRALEEAHAAHAALYVELEKERSAAATAADEAMAMILRLQTGKAAVEMETWQYQRMIEEKSAYDQEEMEILKEIIVRREKEKLVLEKEVEAYRQTAMLPGGEMTVWKLDSSFDLPDDPAPMLHAVCNSIGEKEKVRDEMHWEDEDGRPFAGTSAEENCRQLRDPGEESNLEFQEKGMVTMELYPTSVQKQSCHCHEDSTVIGQEDGKGESTIKARVPFEILCQEDGNGDRCSASSQFETETSILDVHVIDDKHNLSDEGCGKENVASQVGFSLDVSGEDKLRNEYYGNSTAEHSDLNEVESWVGVGGDIRRSCSDMAKGDQVMDSLCDKSSLHDLRRSSMSAIDSERFKLETEVEVLRKRLKTIEQGRERLNFSVGHREKEAFQLQLLEEIACQLQEIRKVTEPGKSVRQTSLPPLSSKINLRKRRCRSVSWGVNGSA